MPASQHGVDHLLVGQRGRSVDDREKETEAVGTLVVWRSFVTAKGNGGEASGILNKICNQ
jgi:hypothetical protein